VKLQTSVYSGRVPEPVRINPGFVRVKYLGSLLTMENRVGEYFLVEKQGLCSEGLSLARATARRDCIFDIEDISALIESKDMPRGNGAMVIGIIPYNLKEIMMPR